MRAVGIHCLDKDIVCYKVQIHLQKIVLELNYDKNYKGSYVGELLARIHRMCIKLYALL